MANRPKHLLQDDSLYFITVRTITGQWFLQPDKYKRILLDVIKSKTSKFNVSLIAFAILHNHYHLMLKLTDAKILPRLIKEINGASSKEINTADNAIGRKIWWNYYDHIIRDETDFFKHLNYIHQNPIKHKLIPVAQTSVCSASEFDYEFSSYNAWVKKKGKEYLDHAFEKYPIVDFVAGVDEF